jgi:homoserine kinase type II
VLNRWITSEEWTHVLEHYAIGALTTAPEPGGGTANANLTLEAETGKYFLKRRNPKYAEQAFVAFDHRLMEHLAPFQIGTPLAVLTHTGERWLAWNGFVYELFPYQPGGAHDRHALTQIASAGSSLAAYHQAVESFAPPPGKDWPRYHDPLLIRAGLEEMDAELRARLSAEDYAYLRAQVEMLERDYPAERYQALPKCVVHGDYHPGNLKFLDDRVAGIFDLDWATVQPRLVDIADGVIFFAGERDSDIDSADIVSLTQTWRPSPERTRVFLDAYQQTLTILPEEWAALDGAVRARWLYCRVIGRSKVPADRPLDFFLNELLEPLRALDAL